MLFSKHIGGLLAMMLAAPLVEEADSSLSDELAGLNMEFASAAEELDRSLNPSTSEKEQGAALDRYQVKVTRLARRGLAFADAHPRTSEALDALVLVSRQDADAERDAAYDLMAERYLDREAILPFVRTAWNDASRTAHVGAFLRAAAERSPNPKVRALACYSLGRHQQNLALVVLDLDHPVRGKRLQKSLGAEGIRRLRSLKPEELRREAETLFGRTIREFADARPLGTDFPPLGEQAEGALFRLRNLEVGCTVPEIEGEDVDGKPMKLSGFRGKVVVISFWATWCAPCMGLVPGEKALVERMRGRPFVLIGVNGDDDRDLARSVSVKEGINWRSFWEGGRQEGTPVRWSIDGWPTVYLIDDKGVIRDDALVGHDLDKSVEALVAEAEAAAKKP